jgi:hypothetical protein
MSEPTETSKVDPAVLAIARALARQAARQDHAAEMARRKPRTGAVVDKENQT